ncbi:cysteine desulfurase family protein [Endomicrobium proavitum]|uniref:Cysteine desulfurase (TRNA sulfurtransferase), PLP-dependent n=1 Tax=Endomicrobium proavitum TaxID=1408281 RepID=A0A0G3WM76_9BACT|nr:cysteine desulfurase family protein [Endomicrobium proavitum]AKL98579.1 cysteine desulfurase (tRNA sulfurtransferase), PLP-dependent [Endomicrobium proavitum]
MKQIYLDNQSNTKIDDRVFEAMKPYFLEFYGNPQSIYSLGAVSKDALEDARGKVAELINADTNEIIFTSCGTESNNLALKGIANALKLSGKHIIVSQIEHFSVLNSVKKLEKEGFEATYLPVDNKGNVLAEDLQKALRPDTILVSIQLANTEVGTIQNIKELAQLTKQNSKAVFHTDAVAAAGVIPVDVKDLGVDALSFSSSVIYGPKGAAALYIKKGAKIIPQLDGGVQEFSKRAGTENIPAIAGFAKACEIAKAELAKNKTHLETLRNKLIKGLQEKIENIYLNGAAAGENRLAGNVNFSVEFVEGESLFLLLDAKGIMAASGSACANKNLKLSHVLNAMNVDVAVGQGSILFTLSKYNTQGEIDYVLEEFPKIVQRLRDMSPLYSHFVKTGERKKAGPGTDFDHDHDHCDIEE